MCPIRSTFVRRYSIFSGLGVVCEGTRSTMRSPYPASPVNFFGLFDMRRMSVMPKSARICAPVPYLHAGARLARGWRAAGCPIGRLGGGVLARVDWQSEL